MDNKLDKREQELVLKNYRLAYHIAKQFPNVEIDSEELGSIGMFGLIKAAQTFNESKGIKFTTYASRCITNEILMYFRKNKCHKSDISLEDELNVDTEGNTLTVLDIISLEKTEFTEIISARNSLEEALNAILNYFKGIKKYVWLYRISGMGQKEIANIFNLSQSYISRLEKKVQKQINLLNFSTLHYKKLFCISIQNYFYDFSFSLQDINNSNLVFIDNLQELALKNRILDSQVRYVNDVIFFRLPLEATSFAFIADVIKLIETDSIL